MYAVMVTFSCILDVLLAASRKVSNSAHTWRYCSSLNKQTNNQTTTKIGIKTHDFQKPVRLYQQLRPRPQLIARFRAIPWHTETIFFCQFPRLFLGTFPEKTHRLLNMGLETRVNI